MILIKNLEKFFNGLFLLGGHNLWDNKSINNCLKAIIELNRCNFTLKFEMLSILA